LVSSFHPQKHELGELQNQLRASKEEKSELLRRLKKVKDVAKESQEKSGKLYVSVQVYPTFH
jgi:predicted HTH transcriptional regulator